MFWDKKRRDESLPDLPQSPDMSAPTIPQIREFNPIEEENFHELPSFPDSPMQQGFSQTAIKDAITNESMESEEDNTMEMEEWTPKQMQSQIPMAPRPQVQTLIEERPVKIATEKRPVFVRVDKFQNARTSLDEIRNKMNDIEDLLKRIRDVKAREDAELSAWEGDMENIKARIQTVMREIFEKSD